MRMMLQKLATHIWPKDQPGLRLRVVVAISLLIGAKVLLVLLQYFVLFYVISLWSGLHSGQTKCCSKLSLSFWHQVLVPALAVPIRRHQVLQSCSIRLKSSSAVGWSSLVWLQVNHSEVMPDWNGCLQQIIISCQINENRVNSIM